MKKIIFLLALLSLGVSKAQVVGGYLPLNSTKSATMGGLKVAGNETVTGTFSVGSTATVTGALNVGGGTNGFIAGNVSGQNRLYTSGNQFYFVNSGNGDAGLSAGTATFGGAIKAQSTMSLGSANLTGGNTGTVAVLSDAVFPIQFGVNSASPGGGAVFTITPNSTGLSTWNNKAMIPYNATVDYFTYALNVIGTLGSSESGTLSLITNTTVTTCTTNVKFNSVNVVGSGTLSVSITSLDQICFKMEMPGMVTLPTSVQISVIAWCRRRQ